MQQHLDARGSTTNNGSIRNPAMMHTLQRHRDTLHQYTKEWRLSRQRAMEAREQRALLGDVRRDIEYAIYQYIVYHVHI